MKKTYRVPCSWEVYGITVVEAESWDEAISTAEESPLPIDNSYIEDSFRIDEAMVEYEREKESTSLQTFLKKRITKPQTL
jgi:hypothetical protein